MRYLLLALLLWPSLCHGREVTPCLEKKRGHWRILRDTECVLYTRADVEEVSKRLLKLDWYIRVYEPKTKQLQKDYERMTTIFNEREKLAKERRQINTEIKKTYEKIALDWKSAFFKLKEKKAPSPHWTSHPAFLVSVGLIGGVAVTIAGVAVYEAVRKK